MEYNYGSAGIWSLEDSDLAGSLQMAAHEDGGDFPLVLFQIIEDFQMLAAVDHDPLESEFPVVLRKAPQLILMANGSMNEPVPRGCSEALVKGGIHFEECDTGGFEPGALEGFLM